MAKKDEKIIMYDSDEAAKKITVTGWVSSEKRFWGDDEHMARWNGCTHLKCECGEIMEKSWTKCASCRAKLDNERYLAMPLKEWDGKAPLVIHRDDTYFWDGEGIKEYMEDHDIEAKDLKLVLCKPNYPSEVHPDRWEDELPEDGDLPNELHKKVDEINKFIKSMDPISWSAGKYRVEYKSQQ